MTTQTVSIQARHDRRSTVGIPVVLLTLAAVAWWWTARMAADMPSGSMTDMGMASEQAMTLGAFLLAWLAMMTAMMFPAIMPVVKLYARGATAGRVAPLPFFVSGYIVVWASLGLPAFFAWQALAQPIAHEQIWPARLAGAVLVAAAVWQLTPLKSS